MENTTFEALMTARPSIGAVVVACASREHLLVGETLTVVAHGERRRPTGDRCPTVTVETATGERFVVFDWARLLGRT